MNAVNKSVTALQQQLHYHKAAILLCAHDMLFFADNEGDGNIQPMIWCGRAFLPDMVEDAACWELAEWEDLPKLKAIYYQFGEVGLFVWCVKKRRAPRDILTPEVLEYYAKVTEFISKNRLNGAGHSIISTLATK